MMRIKKPVVAGNWKMNHGPKETREFFDRFISRYNRAGDRTIAVFPPALSVAAAVEARGESSDLVLGVQNVYWEESGAYTGEVSAGMAAAAGAQWVLVGHSERRHVFGETSEEAARKVEAVHRASLVPLLCVGENLEERKAGKAEAVVLDQLEPVLSKVGEHPLLIAYEPVWAIGTGETATPGDARSIHVAIRERLTEKLGEDRASQIPILYGGSVKPENASELLSTDGIDGVLVGGASLTADSFLEICFAEVDSSRAAS